MKTKKSTSANLELKRKRFLLTGTTIALALTLAAFEWTTYFKVDCKFPPENPIDVWDTDMVPITFSKTPEKVIIEKKKKPTIEIKIVEKIR